MTGVALRFVLGRHIRVKSIIVEYHLVSCMIDTFLLVIIRGDHAQDMSG